MEDNQLLMFLFGAGSGGTVIGSIIIWWIKAAMQNLSAVPKLVEKVEEIKADINAFSGELKSLSSLIHNNNKEIAVLEKSVETQWKRYDDLSKSFREIKL